MKNHLFTVFLLLDLFTPFKVNAQQILEDSVLCRNQSLYTMIAMNTGEFNVAICKGDRSSAYYFVKQNRQNNELILLPIRPQNNPYQGANPWLLKTTQGRYTYQVAEFNPLINNSYVSFSVFENGTRIYHHVTSKYLIGEFGDL